MNKTKESTEKSSVEIDVMSQISSGDVKIKSKNHFIALQAILVISSALLIALAAIFVSLSVNDIQLGQKLALNEFGDTGADAFRSSLPIFMIFFALIATSAVLMLVKHFEFSYKHRFNTLLAAVILSVAGIASVVTAAGLNDRLADSPPFKPLNTLRKLADENRVAGEVVQVSEDSITLIISREGVSKTFKFADNASRKHNVSPGDEVVLFGKKDSSGDFTIYGIRPGKPRVRPNLLNRESINQIKLNEIKSI